MKLLQCSHLYNSQNKLFSAEHVFNNQELIIFTAVYSPPPTTLKLFNKADNKMILNFHDSKATEPNEKQIHLLRKIKKLLFTCIKV